jgi:hypothetical protein
LLLRDESMSTTKYVLGSKRGSLKSAGIVNLF